MIPLPGYDHPVWLLFAVLAWAGGVVTLVWVSTLRDRTTAAGDDAAETDDGFDWFAAAEQARSVREAAQAAEIEAMVGGGR